MIKQYKLKKGQELSPAQLKEIEEVKNRPIVFDEDCPELSPAMMKQFQCMKKKRKK